MLHHNPIEWRGQGRVVKNGKFKAADQSKLVCHTDGSSEEEDLCFYLKQNFKGVNKDF